MKTSNPKTTFILITHFDFRVVQLKENELVDVVRLRAPCLKTFVFFDASPSWGPGTLEHSLCQGSWSPEAEPLPRGTPSTCTPPTSPHRTSRPRMTAATPQGHLKNVDGHPEPARPAWPGLPPHRTQGASRPPHPWLPVSHRLGAASCGAADLEGFLSLPAPLFSLLPVPHKGSCPPLPDPSPAKCEPKESSLPLSCGCWVFVSV